MVLLSISVYMSKRWKYDVEVVLFSNSFLSVVLVICQSFIDFDMKLM